jgi:hypothetical protein
MMPCSVSKDHRFRTFDHKFRFIGNTSPSKVMLMFLSSYVDLHYIDHIFLIKPMNKKAPEPMENTLVECEL